MAKDLLCRCGHRKYSHMLMKGRCLQSGCDCKVYAPQVIYTELEQKRK